MSESAAGTQRFDLIGVIGLVGLLALVLGAFLIGEFEVSDVTGSDVIGSDLITLPMVGLPILAALVMLGITTSLPENVDVGIYIRWATLAIASVPLAISTLMMFGAVDGFDLSALGRNQYAMYFEYAWMPQIGDGIHWRVGLDGLSFPMVWLTAMLVPITLITTWNERNSAVHHPLVLLMGGALIGVFVALDLFMFYMFWEFTLIPMFFLILKWGGSERRYAAQKFFIYTFSASVIMLMGFITLYFAGGRSFDLVALAQGSAALDPTLARVVFWMLMFGFLVKLPAAPFHTWLPDAHVQAPTAGSMLLAGVMLKMGAYGMFRFPLTMLGELGDGTSLLEEYQMILMIIGMISLVYGSIVCLGQTNLKRMVAYSSVSHMGVILLGIATLEPLGYAAAMFMMFAHGIISPMLFAVCGAFKHHYHSMEIGAMRGMARHSPWIATSMMFAWMGSLGLPLLAGFVAEFLLLIAFWHAGFQWWILPIGATLAITAAYYLWSMQRTIFEGGEHGQLPATLEGQEVPDLDPWERAGMLIMAALTILFGVLPFLVLDMMNAWSAVALGVI